MKTKLEIIKETAEFYNLSNRSFVPEKNNPNDGNCVYLTSDGKMCAVGRCMINPSQYLNKIEINVETLDQSTKGGLDTLLKEEYRGNGIGFWTDLQRLHDSSLYWTETGLSKSGQQYYDRLVERWVTDYKTHGDTLCNV